MGALDLWSCFSSNFGSSMLILLNITHIQWPSQCKGRIPTDDGVRKPWNFFLARQSYARLNSENAGWFCQTWLGLIQINQLGIHYLYGKPFFLPQSGSNIPWIFFFWQSFDVIFLLHFSPFHEILRFLKKNIFSDQIDEKNSQNSKKNKTIF